MKCPVCKTEVHDKNVCEMCGFDDIRSEFLSQEDADFWMQNVVIPYKDNYEQSNVLPTINWLDFFKQNTQAKQLFEISIPAAIKRRESIDLAKDSMDFEEYFEYSKDATWGHLAIISSSDKIRKRFIDVIDGEYFATTSFKQTSSAAIERARDLVAIVTALQSGEVLVFEVCSKIKKDVAKLFASALSDFSVEITVGKGPGARVIKLDLPVFTTIFLAESIEDIPNDIRNTLNAIIEINPSQDELEELQIREMANLYDVQLTQATLRVIKEYNSNKVIKNIKGTLKFISDYLYLHSEVQQPITAENLNKIIETLS